MSLLGATIYSTMNRNLGTHVTETIYSGPTLSEGFDFDATSDIHCSDFDFNLVLLLY